jgi:hypothetical protein
VLRLWADSPNERKFDGVVFNAAIVCLRLFSRASSQALPPHAPDLSVASSALFAPLFISPEVDFWKQVHEYTMIVREDHTGHSACIADSPDTLSSLFALAGIYILRGIKRAWNYLQEHRHRSPEAAAAAAQNDLDFNQQFIWQLCVNWATSFGRALLQWQKLDAENIGSLPAWMIEVCVRGFFILHVITTVLLMRFMMKHFSILL